MQVLIADLRIALEKIFSASKIAKEDLNSIFDYLLWAEMSDIKTQGLIKLTSTEPLQNIVPKCKMKIVHQTKLSQIIDAGAHPAPLACTVGMNAVIEIANEHGFGIVGIKNTFSSNGAQAYYVEKIAQQDLIGFMCSSSPASTSGFGSIDPLFGTNPFGVSFPTLNDPIVFDMATSAMTFYGLVLAKAKGQKIPLDVALDKFGNPTDDPKLAMEGSILPFSGYKGSGLGLFVEMLTGPLLNSAFIDNKTFDLEWGTTIVALNPKLLTKLDAFKESASAMIKAIKSSRKKTIADIRLPGERARLAYNTALQRGWVDIDDDLAKELGL